MSGQMRAAPPMQICKTEGRVEAMTGADEWPKRQAEFFALYDQLLEASPYDSTEELAAAAGFAASNISRWRNEKRPAQPSAKLLSRLAPVLGVTKFRLWEAAGILPDGAEKAILVNAGTGIKAAPEEPRVLPKQLSVLADRYNQLDREGRKRLVHQLDMLIEWADAALTRG